MLYNFEYFYGNEAQQFQFYMLPQLLFTDDKFKRLSSDSKILYSLLLDRAGLSLRNAEQFRDEKGRAYIYFTREETMKMLGCTKEKSAACFSELEKIGLIERIRQGMGKPVKIYVKHFYKLIKKSKKSLPESKDKKSSDLLSEKKNILMTENADLLTSENADFLTSGNTDLLTSENADFLTSGNADLLTSENADFLTSGNADLLTSGNADLLTSANPDAINTYINHTDINHTDISSSVIDNIKEKQKIKDDDDIKNFILKFKNNIEYNHLIAKHDKSLIDEIVSSVLFVFKNPAKSIRISKSDISTYEVLKAFLKLRREHIEYLLMQLKNSTEKVTNMKAYILACLYNAVATANLNRHKGSGVKKGTSYDLDEWEKFALNCNPMSMMKSNKEDVQLE